MNPQPKQKTKRNKKACNGYKDKPQRECFYCGTKAAERHELFGGSNRNISIECGFQVDLCPMCHEAMHKQNEQTWRERKLEWRQKYQWEYEEKIVADGYTGQEAREDWMRLIGKNFL